jgi:hypothetical protein
MSNCPKIPEGWEQVKYHPECGDLLWRQSINGWVVLGDSFLVDPFESMVIRRVQRPYDNACGTIYIGTER